MVESKRSIEGLENAGEDMLRMKIGMVFPKGEEPKNAPGMIRHSAPAGAKWAKFYFPPKGHDLLDGGFEYTVPECMSGASWGELLLANRPVLFGRVGEDKPFTFDTKSGIPIFLRIYRGENPGFSTLYVRAGNGEEVSFSYFALMIKWIGDTISVNLYPVEEEEVPPVLKA